MFLHRVCRPLPCCSFLLAAFFSLSANAQATFADSTDLLGQQALHSGIAVGIADVDDDGLDDLLVLDDARILHVFFQKADGGFEGVQVGELASNNIWSMTAGDVDNDGWLEIMTGGYYEGIRITDWHAADSTWQSGLLPESDIFVQGSNFADLDADGWLEAFACHDDAASRLWRNLGNGLFEPAFDWIDFHTTPPSDNSGNYGSVWTDFDTDGDIDLYIAKCRQGVDDPQDARRINVLYENDGTATFAETGGAWGLRIAHQSWTAEFQDIDNDGDFDALVTNHDAPLQLLENQGGRFVDIAAEAGVAVDGYFLQGIMRDLDNDGFVDILLASPARYFHNNGDKTFTQVQVPPFTQTMLSLATGDL
ncbi:MAG: VCBS repeat-containing protein, partial [Bacteroidetes bacterium]